MDVKKSGNSATKRSKPWNITLVNNVICSVLSGFALTNLFCVLLSESNFKDLTLYYNEIDKVMFLLSILLFSGMILFASVYLRKSKISAYALFCSSTALACGLAYKLISPSIEATMANNSTKSLPTEIYFILGLGVVLFILIRWLTKDDKMAIGKAKLGYTPVLITTICLFLAVSIYVAYHTVLRYLSYDASAFDLGVFTQMFESMRRTGLPYTTVERNYSLSHFGVHFSPSFYLLLPFYMISPCPETLLTLQALVAMAGIFAVYGICKKLGLSPKVTLAFVIIYAFYPSLSRACFYDFHENKMLTVLLLYTVYFFVAKKPLFTALFALFTLGVKEDAAIYVFCLAVFMLFQSGLESKPISKKYKFINVQSTTAFCILCFSMLYFVFAQGMVAYLGEGVMTDRLAPFFIGEDNGFGSVIKACFFNFPYLIKQIFTIDRLPYILWMLLPIGFMPFVNKKISTLIMLLPMVVVNLMPSWPYQFNIGYQYSYGVAALIITASIFTVKTMKPQIKRTVLLMSIALSLTSFCALTVTRAEETSQRYEIIKERAKKVDELLKTVPEDASISSSTYLIPHIYKNYDNVFTLPSIYGDDHRTDYILVDTRWSDPFYAEFMGDDYTLLSQAEFVQIYKQK